MLVDTHCHLGAAQFDDDRADVVTRARDAGVDHVVVVADSEPATVKAIDIAIEFQLSATAGVHPHEASSWTPEIAARIETALSRTEVVAVGETGLDYHYNHSPPETQRQTFADQLALGSRYDMPVVVHSREADDDMAAMLRDTDATVILHSFSSGRDLLLTGIEIGAYVSFSGMITFRSWKDAEAVEAVPPDRLLVETDAPYLAPTPHRGKRNEPSFVVRVAERLAAMRSTSPEEIAVQTTRNAVSCFGSRVAPTPIGQ